MKTGILALGIVLGSLAPGSLLAQTTYNWNGTSSTAWTTKQNWTATITNGPGSSNIGQFSSTFAVGRKQPTINASSSVGKLLFVSSLLQNVTISGSKALTIYGLSNIGIDNQQSAKTVAINAPLVLNASQTWQISAASGGSLAFGGTLNLGASTLTLSPNNGTATITHNGVISGTGGLLVNGLGTVTLSGANIYTGATTISAGTLNSNNATALGNLANVTLSAAGATIGIGVNQAISALNGSAGNVTLGANTLTVGGTDNLSSSYGGIIGDTGSLTKAGTGTLTLSGTNTYTGNTAVNVGVLNIQNGSALGTGTAATSVTSGAALQLQNNITVNEALTLNGTGISSDGALRSISGNNTWSGAITLGSAARINSDTSTDTLTVSGNITGAGQSLTVGGAGNTTISTGLNTGTSGTLTKDGTGTLDITAAGNYTGATTISAGTLNSNIANALGTLANVTLASSSSTLGIGATQTISALNGSAGNVTLGANTLTVGGTDNLSSSFGGVIAGTGNLTKAGTGDFTVSGANTFTGAISVSAGNLVLGVNNTLGAQNNSVNIASGATMSLTSGADSSHVYTNTIGALTGTGTISIGTYAKAVLNVSSTDTFGGLIVASSGASTSTFELNNSTAGNLTLTNGSTNFAGLMQVDQGTLAFTNSASGSTFANLTVGNLLTITTLLLNNANINVGTLTITGNTILDFGTSGASILNCTNIYIAAGYTLTVLNWNSEVDFLYARTAFGQISGSGATPNAI